MKISSKHIVPAVGVLVGILTVTADVSGKSADRNLVAEVKAGSWSEDPEAGTQVFTNGFQLTQGTLIIEGDQATIYRDDQGGFKRIILQGEPARWKEQLDDGSPLDAQAQKIDYDVAGDKVLLSGNVEIVKASDELSANEVSYDLKTQKLDAQGSEAGVLLRYAPPKKETP